MGCDLDSFFVPGQRRSRPDTFDAGGSADYKATEADGHNHWQERRYGTCHTNVLSALRLQAARAPAQM